MTENANLSGAAGKTHPLSIISMTLGIGSLLTWVYLGLTEHVLMAMWTLPLSLPAVVTSHISIRLIKRSSARGRGFALTGLFAGYISLGLLIAIYAVVIYAFWVWGRGGKGFF